MRKLTNWRKLINWTVVDEHILLNGLYARDVLFSGCIVEVWADGDKCDIQDCHFENCQIRGDAWPPNMVAAAQRAQETGT